MRLLHASSRTRAVFDDPNLIACAGLVPLAELARSARLPELLSAKVRPAGPCAANAPAKAGCLIAGMAADADSVDDMALLRHGAMETVFGGLTARRSSPGSTPRSTVPR